jgi:hypothetical protein
MSPGILSRWPVLVSLPVAASDCDADGRLVNAAVERLFAEARATYFERCPTVDPSSLELQSSKVDRGLATVTSDGVTVSVGVVEVFPDRFTMLARVRPVGPADGDGLAATASCSLSPGGEVPNAMRDEFIALAHSAAHIH